MRSRHQPCLTAAAKDIVVLTVARSLGGHVDYIIIYITPVYINGLDIIWRLASVCGRRSRTGAILPRTLQLIFRDVSDTSFYNEQNSWCLFIY